MKASQATTRYPANANLFYSPIFSGWFVLSPLGKAAKPQKGMEQNFCHDRSLHYIDQLLYASNKSLSILIIYYLNDFIHVCGHGTGANFDQHKKLL